MHFTTASLLPLLSLTSALPSQPIARQEAAPSYPCSDNVSKPWTVTGFSYRGSYIFTTPAHQNSAGFVNFNLTHPSLAGAVATCEARSSQLSEFFFGTQRYACTWPAGAGGQFPPDAGFNFSVPAKRLDIDQSWICNDREPQFPARYWAWGNATLPLECSDTGTVYTPDWQIGQIYSTREVKCELPSAEVEVDRIQAIA